MWLMLQHDEPDDYVLATGTTHSLRDFVAIAFAHAGLDWREHVRYDETLRAPAEVHALIGDPTKAQQTLGWVAATNVEQLAAMMVDADLETA
jgi:GDPmannose 4,6-dehydratase